MDFVSITFFIIYIFCFSDDDDEHARPSSAASSRSLPSSKIWRRKKKAKQPSEVGIRNVAAYKGHQVIGEKSPRNGISKVCRCDNQVFLMRTAKLMWICQKTIAVTKKSGYEQKLSKIRKKKCEIDVFSKVFAML